MTDTKKTGLTFTHSGHRYRLDGLPVTGVTTLIGGGVPKPALPYWAANVAAQYAVEHPAASYDEIRKAPWEERDAAGVKGTTVHDIAEKVIHGEAVEVDEEIAPYLDGYIAFLDRWEITPVLTEKTVASRKDWYAGKFDLIATSPLLNDGLPFMIDLKTSKSVYGETALQCAAYSRAEFYVEQEAPGVELRIPTVTATFVAHVTADGTHLYQLASSPEEIETHFQMFLAAAYTHKTTKLRDAIIGEPLQPEMETVSL